MGNIIRQENNESDEAQQKSSGSMKSRDGIAVEPDKLSEAFMLMAQQKDLINHRKVNDRRSIQIIRESNEKEANSHQTELKNFDFKNDFEDWRNFVYKIKLRLNQVEETSEVHERSFRPLRSVTEKPQETPRYVDRPMLLTSISIHPGHQKTQEKDCHGTFTFLHMLIISKNMKFLRDMVDQNLIDDEELLKPVEVHCDYERIVEEDSWLDGANCIHLAAKFMPMGMELLFSVSKDLPKLTHSPNKNGQAPLHIAARNKDTLSTKILLSVGANGNQVDNKNYTPLFYAASSGSRGSNVLELLDQENVDVNHKGKNGKTALSKARTHEIITLLLNHGAEATSSDFDIFLKHLNANSARAMLNKYIDTNDDEDLLVLDFSFFQHEEKKKRLDMTLYRDIEDTGKQELFLHPILRAFLGLKWDQIRKHYMLQLFLSLIFAIVLTLASYYFLDLAYCASCDEIHDEYDGLFSELHVSRKISIKDPLGEIQCFGVTPQNKTRYKFDEDVTWDDSCKLGQESCAFITQNDGKKMMNDLAANGSKLRCHKNFLRASDDSPYPLDPICKTMGMSIFQCWWTDARIALLIMLISLFIFFEVFELYRTPKSYFVKLENYLQIVIAILTVGFICLAPSNIELANHFGAMAVFFVWLNLTQLLGRFGYFGLNIFMAIQVGNNILKAISVFTPGFIAFIFGFNMLYLTNPAFHGLIETSVKVFVMLQGEFEFDANLGYKTVHEHGGRNITVQILFFLFVIWMAFIFMNLLVGLTVTSMDELKRTGTLIQVEKRVDDIQLIEEILPVCAMPGNIMSTFDQNETNQVCVKLDKKKAHTLDPFNVFGKGHQLYHYNDLDSKAGEKIPKRYISEESVDSALETLKEVNEKIKAFQEKWAEIKSQSSNLFKNRNEKIQFSKSTKSSSKDIRSVLKNLQNRVQTDLKFLQGSKSEEFSKIEESLENLQDLMQNSNLEYKI